MRRNPGRSAAPLLLPERELFSLRPPPLGRRAPAWAVVLAAAALAGASLLAEPLRRRRPTIVLRPPADT